MTNNKTYAKAAALLGWQFSDAYELTEGLGMAIDVEGTPEDYVVYSFPDLGEIWIRNADKAFRINVAEIRLADFLQMEEDLG